LDKVERQQKLKIKEILDDIKLIDIKAFLLQYSKKNKDFELAFKSHFLSRVNIGDHGIKYKKLLDELVKPKTNRNNKVGATAKRTITIILEDFVIQMNDCLSTESFTEAYYIIKESLEKITYLQNRFEVKDISIEKCRLQFLAGLDVILKKDLAPAFRNKLEKELSALITKSYFIPKSVNLISLLNEYNVFIESDRANIIEDLKRKLNRDDYLSIVKTIIQLTCPYEELAKSMLITFDHHKVFEALTELIKEGKYTFVEFYLDNKAVNFKHNKSILQSNMANSREDYTALTKYIKQIVISETDPFMLDDFLATLDDLYLKKHLKKIKKWVDQLSFRHKIDLNSRAQNYKAVVQLLDEQKDLEWNKLYDQLLRDNGMDEEVDQLYLDLTHDFIENHIGIKAQDYLHKLGNHFRQNSQLDLMHNIRKHLKKNFAHRDSVQNF